VQELRVLDDEIAHRVNVVAPDCVDQLTALHEAHPTRRLIAARENELRVGELGVRRVDFVGAKLPELRDRGWIAAVNVAEQILGLVL
jgi:hypothetical protein